MTLEATERGWNVPLDQAHVERIEIDFRLGLVIVDGNQSLSIYIEATCTLSSADQAWSMLPEKTSTLAPVLPLFNSKVTDIRIDRDGTLLIRFSEGRSLKVLPDHRYEAWQVASSAGFLFVCAPGGSVSLFKEQEPPNNQRSEF